MLRLPLFQSLAKRYNFVCRCIISKGDDDCKRMIAMITTIIMMMLHSNNHINLTNSHNNDDDKHHRKICNFYNQNTYSNKVYNNIKS